MAEGKGVLISEKDAARLQKMLKDYESRAPVRRDRRRHMAREGAGAVPPVGGGSIRLGFIVAAPQVGFHTFNVHLDHPEGELVEVYLIIYGGFGDNLIQPDIIPALSTTWPRNVVWVGWNEYLRRWLNVTSVFLVEDCEEEA